MAKKRETLLVKITYEPNRFATTHLMDAYEFLASNTHPFPKSQLTPGFHKAEPEVKNEDNK